MNEGWLVTVQWGDDPVQRPIVPDNDSTFIGFRHRDEKTDIGNQAGQHDHAVELHQIHAGLCGDCGSAWPCERAELVALAHAFGMAWLVCSVLPVKEMLLLTELNRICDEAPAFSLGFPDSNLPVADEYAFGFRLLDIGYGVLKHARERIPLKTSDSTQGLGDATVELKRQFRQHQGGDNDADDI